MRLADYLRLLRTRWLSIGLLTILGAFAGLGVSLVATPSFSAQTQLFVSTRVADTTSDLVQGSNFAVQRVRSYIELVRSPRVLQPVIDRLGLPYTVGELGQRITVDSPRDTVLINIRVDDPSAEQAAAIANAVGDSLSGVVEEVETHQDETQSPVQVSTVQVATQPTAPSSPNTRMNLAFGLVAGLGLGLGITVLRKVLTEKPATTPASQPAAISGGVQLELGPAAGPVLPHCHECRHHLDESGRLTSVGTHGEMMVGKDP